MLTSAVLEILFLTVVSSEDCIKSQGGWREKTVNGFEQTLEGKEVFLKYNCDEEKRQNETAANEKPIDEKYAPLLEGGEEKQDSLPSSLTDAAGDEKNNGKEVQQPEDYVEDPDAVDFFYSSDDDVQKEAADALKVNLPSVLQVSGTYYVYCSRYSISNFQVNGEGEEHEDFVGYGVNCKFAQVL
ncbi:unnamed protein product [Cylicocyclus nassatus]|uniref:Uncharacterized protein n=1 Tax=Cylicocyclus nassatus TaxID=53992 RepID=A0AA36DRZ4_CYLNA|nr:unnamed protein product [Cylicocyclus nassatus]